MNILETQVYLAPFEEAVFLSVLYQEKTFGLGDIFGILKQTYSKMAASSTPYRTHYEEGAYSVYVNGFSVPVYALKLSDNISLQKRINEYRKPLKEKLYLYLNFL